MNVQLLKLIPCEVSLVLWSKYDQVFPVADCMNSFFVAVRFIKSNQDINIMSSCFAEEFDFALLYPDILEKHSFHSYFRQICLPVSSTFLKFGKSIRK